MEAGAIEFVVLPPEVLERHAEQKDEDDVETKSICADDHHVLEIGHRNGGGSRTDAAGLLLAGAPVQALVRFGRLQLFAPRLRDFLIVGRFLEQNVRDDLFLADDLVVLLRIGVDLEDVFLSIEIVVLQLDLSAGRIRNG